MPPVCRAIRLLGIVVPLLAAGPLAAQQDAPAGTVTVRSGAVNAVRDGVARSLAAGDPVFVSDLVVTGAESRVSIRFADRAVLIVGPRTQAEIAQYYGRPADGMFRGVLSLITGIVRVIFSAGDPDRQFDVQTRNAVASARSTEWIVEATPERTAVLALDGRIVVRGTAVGDTVLGPGDGTDVAGGGPPTPATQWGAARVRDVVARTQVP